MTTKTDEQIIRKIARICDIKSVAGRICGTDKFLAWSETLKEGKQMRVVTMKLKNCHVRKNVKARETESQEKVQEVDSDSRDKVIHIEKSEYVLFKEKQVGALGAGYFVHENSIVTLLSRLQSISY